MVMFDGANKLIILSGAASFNLRTDLYDASQEWGVMYNNMQYLLPFSTTGYVALGGGVYTDIIFELVNGWKIQPSGYSANTQVTLTGTLTTSDGLPYAVSPSSGSPVQFFVQAATAGTIIDAGLTPDQDAELSAIYAKTSNLPEGIPKNQALPNFSFLMYDNAGNPATGLSVTAQRSIDGAAFASCANSAHELGLGFYLIDLAASDLNGDVVSLRFSAAGAKDTAITIKTQT